MRYFLTLLAGLALLAACAPQDRIYDVTEIDQPPEMLGDSIEVVAPRPVPADTTR